MVENGLQPSKTHQCCRGSRGKANCCCLRAAQGSFALTMEGWEGCLVQYFHVLTWFVQSSAQVSPRTINTCNCRASFFLFVPFPFLEMARKGCQGIKTLLKVKLLQVLSEPQWKCFRGERRPARGKCLSPWLPSAAQFCFTNTWACSYHWSCFTKKLPVQLLLFPHPSCGFPNPDLAFHHYTVFLKLLLWPAE